jgi:hypothetical protein
MERFGYWFMTVAEITIWVVNDWIQEGPLHLDARGAWSNVIMHWRYRSYPSRQRMDRNPFSFCNIWGRYEASLKRRTKRSAQKTPTTFVI